MKFSRKYPFVTVDAEAMEKFERLSSQWWKNESRATPLHSLNILRVPWIVEGIVEAGLISRDELKCSRPLQGLKILDIGCGVGILAEALAKYGCTIVGIDPCEDMINEAKRHMALDPSLTNITYFNRTIEEHGEYYYEAYDAVIISEVIDQVNEQNMFLDMCCDCLKPGGPIYITTFNQTVTSWLLGIIFFEYIWGVYVQGDHLWWKFITPELLKEYLKRYDCRTKHIRGMLFNCITYTWHWSKCDSMHYAVCAVKDKKR